VTAWACPECTGKWIRNFVFDHTNGCTIRRAEDATQDADFERLVTRRTIARDATATEIELCWRVFQHVVVDVAQFHAPDQPASKGTNPQTVVTADAPGMHHRVVSGVDPDKLVEEMEL
jgi:hypothetical protein